MSSSQLKAMMDKQESEVVRQSVDEVDFLNKTVQLSDNENDNDNEDLGCSYLDQVSRLKKLFSFVTVTNKLECLFLAGIFSLRLYF